MEPTMEKDIEAQTKRAEQSQAATIFKRANRPVTLKVEDLAHLSFQTTPVYIDVDDGRNKVTNEGLQQGYCVVPSAKRFVLLYSFLKRNLSKKVMVFFSSCNSVKFHSELLTYIQVECFDIHGKQKQQKRTTTFFDFCKAEKGILLCTDVAARGLDIPSVPQTKRNPNFLTGHHTLGPKTILERKVDSISNDLRRAIDTLRVVTENLRIRENRAPPVRHAYVSPMGARGQRRGRRHVQPAPPEFSESDEGGIRHRRYRDRVSSSDEEVEQWILGNPGTRARHWCSGHETEVHALFVGDTLMLSFLLTSGFYIQNVPGFMAWIGYISVSHHAFKLLLGSQYKASDTYSCGDSGGGFKFCKVGEYPAIKTVGLDGQVVSVIVLAAMLVVFRVLAYIALMRIEVTRKQRKFPLFSAEYYKHILCLQVHC
ncbi:hypothetical protein LWI28_026819 [Acer negundo]|uniref:ATP-dependent RNA helicase n=1 Tax=Acer negundo TaxID=4023 RepID=A0AAD5JBP0_ACENE|nr:hypothetical protein LWI28_026819 [Acer negundo]